MAGILSGETIVWFTLAFSYYARCSSQNKQDRAFVHPSCRLLPRLMLRLPFPGDKLQRRFRRWLSAADPSTNHNIARKVHHRGTATWFTEGKTFKDWKTTGSILWIHGKRRPSIHSEVLLLVLMCFSRRFFSGIGEERALVCVAVCFVKLVVLTLQPAQRLSKTSGTRVKQD
jgi:hypothetical protein